MRSFSSSGKHNDLLKMKTRLMQYRKNDDKFNQG